MPGQLKAFSCHAIQMRRRCIATMKANVTPTQVVCNDKNYVGTILRRRIIGC